MGATFSLVAMYQGFATGAPGIELFTTSGTFHLFCSASVGMNVTLLERALAHLTAQRLGAGRPAGPELFQNLFTLLLDFGLAFPLL